MANAIASAPARATKAPARAKPASAPAPAPAYSMTEAHHLVAQVADVINAMIIPASSHWPWGNFPGRENLITADNLLATLAENCGDPVAIEATGEKSIPRQLLCIDEQLDEAITQMLAADSHDVGQRYTLLLLASRAGEFIDELSEAYAGLPGTLADLRAMTTYEGLVARREPPPRKPTPPIRRVDHSHTPEQLHTVLEFIAGAAHTQCNILMMAQTGIEQWERSNLVDAARAMALQIGAAADSAIGGEVLGTMTRWNYGPLFDTMGKAGAA